MKVVTVAGDISVPATITALFQAVKVRFVTCIQGRGCHGVSYSLYNVGDVLSRTILMIISQH